METELPFPPPSVVTNRLLPCQVEIKASLRLASPPCGSPNQSTGKPRRNRTPSSAFLQTGDGARLLIKG